MAQKNKREMRLRRKKSIRRKVIGTTERPRLAVFRSNKYFYAQIIDDMIGKTLVSVSMKDEPKTETKKISKTEKATFLGQKMAEKALEKNIEKVVFDRGGYAYHGRVKAFAEAARLKGLQF